MAEEGIGYKNPPKEHQWKPGESGNPDGRPAGVPNRGTALRKFLSAPAKFKTPPTADNPDGEEIEGTAEEMMAMAMIAAASMGDVNAFKAVMDDVYGKLTDKVETTTVRKVTRKIGGRTAAPDEPGA